MFTGPTTIRSRPEAAPGWLPCDAQSQQSVLATLQAAAGQGAAALSCPLSSMPAPSQMCTRQAWCPQQAPKDYGVSYCCAPTLLPCSLQEESASSGDSDDGQVPRSAPQRRTVRTAKGSRHSSGDFEVTSSSDEEEVRFLLCSNHHKSYAWLVLGICWSTPAGEVIDCILPGKCDSYKG